MIRPKKQFNWWWLEDWNQVNGDYPDNINNEFDTDFQLAANLMQEENGDFSGFHREDLDF